MVVFAALLSLPSGALGAWLYLTYGKPPEPVEKSAPTVSPRSENAAAIAQVPAASVDELKKVCKDVDGVSERLDRLQERFATFPRPEPPPDLTALKAQIENLTKDDTSFAALPGRIGALGDRVAAIEKSLAALRATISPAEGQVKKTAGSNRTRSPGQ